MEMRKYPIVVSTLTFMLKADPPTTNPADMHKLHKLYSSGPAPPVRFLQREDVLRLFVQDLYSPAKQIPPQHRDKYIYLLAYAVSVRHDGTGPPDKSQLEPTKRALDASQAICKNNQVTAQEAEKQLALLQEHPVIAVGLLHWISVNLADAEFFTGVGYAESTKIYLRLLHCIIECHELQWVKVHPPQAHTLCRNHCTGNGWCHGRCCSLSCRALL